MSHTLAYKTPIIVCEGLSERDYLTTLNRLLVRGDYTAFCKPITAGSGDFSTIRKCLIREKRNNLKTDIYVWVDEDLYFRNSQKSLTEYKNKTSNIPDFWFSRMNFEDFLSLHYPSEQLKKYEKTLEKKGHFTNPLTGSAHLPIFQECICSDYEKGSLPFDLNKERLELLFSNMGNSRFHCGFAKWLNHEIDTGLVSYR